MSELREGNQFYIVCPVKGWVCLGVISYEQAKERLALEDSPNACLWEGKPR
tara:strand:+ start:1365 stop:1517 length:153 start_codon:yes stop_codon:yes gene_type:complete